MIWIYSSSMLGWMKLTFFGRKWLKLVFSGWTHTLFFLMTLSRMKISLLVRKSLFISHILKLKYFILLPSDSYDQNCPNLKVFLIWFNSYTGARDHGLPFKRYLDMNSFRNTWYNAEKLYCIYTWDS